MMLGKVQYMGGAAKEKVQTIQKLTADPIATHGVYSSSIEKKLDLVPRR